MTIIARYQASDGPRLAEVVDDRLHDIVVASGLVPTVLTDLIGHDWTTDADEVMPVADATLLAPHPTPPRNVMCIGKNYREHAAEFAGSGFDRSDQAGDEEEFPFVVFSKPWTSIVGPTEAIKFDPEVTLAIDYEVELAVIVGTEGRNIEPEDAFQHVFGYTIVNDVTARDLQQKHRQWYVGKSLDTFCPMGPVVVTADSLDVSNLELRTHVNGELRQKGTTADLIYDVADIIARLSRTMTLLPGDVIATGTPAGVGIGFDPPRFLCDGDVVEVAIAGIGQFESRVRSTRR